MKKYAPLLLVLVVLEMILYLPLLPSFFDPQEFISFLNPLKGGMGFGDYMVQSWSWMQDGQRIGFFRPVMSLLFMAEYPVWEGNPSGYRAMNVFLHLSVALLMIPLAGRIGIKKFWWLPALLVIVHPGAFVAVWMIVSRHDVLAVLFSVLALILTFDLLRGKLKGARGVLPWAAALLALGSKELGMANIIALPLLALLWPERSPEGKAMKFFWFSMPAVLLLFFGSRLIVFGNIGGYGQYTSLLLIPSRVYYMVIQGTGYFFMQNLLLRIVLVLTAAFLAFSLARVWKKQWRKILLLAGFFFLYGFQSIISTPCSHYVYSLMVFFSIIAGFALETGSSLSSKSFPVRAIPGILLAAVLFYASLNQSAILRETNIPRRDVFEALSAHADEIVQEDTIAVLLNDRTDSWIDELKNIELFMEYLKPGNEVEFRLMQYPSEASPGEAVLSWRDGGLVIERLF